MKINAHAAKGFSLIEIMIVVLVIGVLAGIAYPVYQQYVLRAQRAEAKAALQEAVQWMERHYSLTQDYRTQVNNSAINNAAIAAQPFGVAPRGATGGAIRYNMTFSVVPTQNTYTLQMAPANAQTADTKCGTLTLSNTQVRTASGTEGATACWSR